MTRLTVRERQALAERMPWVTKLPDPVSCQGFMAHTPLKAVFAMGGQAPVAREHYACKKPARWHFKALKKSFPSTGDYCWVHLVYRCLYGDDLETGRTHAWLEEQAPEVKP